MSRLGKLVQASINKGQEWLPLNLSDANIPQEQLHGLLSGVLHIHVYAVDDEKIMAFERLPGPPHPSPQTLKVSSRLWQFYSLPASLQIAFLAPHTTMNGIQDLSLDY